MRHDLFNEHIAIMLISNGADPTAKDGAGRIPIEMLEVDRYKECYTRCREAKSVAALSRIAQRRAECPIWPQQVRTIAKFLVPKKWIDKLTKTA